MFEALPRFEDRALPRQLITNKVFILDAVFACGHFKHCELKLKPEHGYDPPDINLPCPDCDPENWFWVCKL